MLRGMTPADMYCSISDDSSSNELHHARRLTPTRARPHSPCNTITPSPPGPRRLASLPYFRLKGGRVFVLSTLHEPAGHPGPRPLEGTQDYVDLIFLLGND